MNKPIFAMGLLMFGLFIMQVLRDNPWGFFHNEKLNPTSCKAAIVKIEKKIPANWKIFCEGNNLAVEVKELAIPAKATNLKALMYRQLANHMSYVARTSQPDILEKVFLVRFKLDHERMEINAVTEGKFIVKLATLENPEHIMTHLQSTVHVKETVK